MTSSGAGTGPSPASAKAQLRRHALQRRAASSTAERAGSASSLERALVPRLPPGGPVAAYVAMDGEPDPASFVAAARAAGHRVLLPVLLAGGDLDWIASDDAPLTSGRQGTRHPDGPLLGRDAIADCALVVVPALAVDRAGVRLGRGGGGYDRALGRTQGYVVAALHAGELHVQLPSEPHDRPVDGAVAGGPLVRIRPHTGDGVWPG